MTFANLKKRASFLLLLPVLLFCNFSNTWADAGYRLWLRYDKIQNEELRVSYVQQIQQLHYAGSSSMIEKAKEEIKRGLSGLLSQNVAFSDHPVNQKQFNDRWTTTRIH